MEYFYSEDTSEDGPTNVMTIVGNTGGIGTQHMTVIRYLSDKQLHRTDGPAYIRIVTTGTDITKVVKSHYIRGLIMSTEEHDLAREAPDEMLPLLCLHNPGAKERLAIGNKAYREKAEVVGLPDEYRWILSIE